MINETYMPIDVPLLRIDREKLLEFHDFFKYHDKGEITSKIGNPWYMLTLCSRNEWKFSDPIVQTIRQHVELLPFDYLQQVYFLEQLDEVKLHRDVSREKDVEYLGPSTYRVSVLNDEPGSTFYFIRDDDEEQNKRFLNLPSFTNTFAINNNVSKHGSLMPKDPKSRKIIMAIWGKVNPKKHLELLRRSYEKYS